MLISQVYPSEFIKAADLQDQNVRVVMDHIELREVGDEQKPVLYFQGKEKGLVLNKTNANNIALVYGEDTDEWVGKALILYPTMVDYQGRSVPAIRVRVPQAKDRQRETRGTNGPARRPSVAEELDDEIPF
jgi:hypothetical protein